MGEDRPVFHRILLKLSGEALQGSSDFGIDAVVLDRICTEIEKVRSLGVQVGIVIGGGNLFRGASLSKTGLNRITGDQIGMLATMMNALAIRDVFEQNKMPTRIMSAISMTGVIDHYNRRKAIYHLDMGRVVIFSGGTGNPLVTTDSAATLRAIEIEADILLKATHVDGVYSADPSKDPHAIRYNHLSYRAVLAEELGVMDLSAFCQARDHNLPIRIFDITKPESLLRIVLGGTEGTLVDSQEG